jgi:hypothetical protein
MAGAVFPLSTSSAIKMKENCHEQLDTTCPVSSDCMFNGEKLPLFPGSKQSEREREENSNCESTNATLSRHALDVDFKAFPTK